jgi:hypothetical protein
VQGADALPHTGKQHAAIGIGLGGAGDKIQIGQGARALLAQEVRNPRAGKYMFSVHACGGGSAVAYRDLFLKHFTCRLVIYGYTEVTKDATRVQEFASVPFAPPFADGKEGKYQKFELTTVLRSQDGGAMQTTRGVGVAVVVQKTSPGVLEVPAGAGAFVRVDEVELEFVARPRNDDVQV